MHRFAILPQQVRAGKIAISGSDARHIQKVLRMKAGDEIVVFNNTGREYMVRLTKVSNKEIEGEITDERNIKAETTVKVTLAQSLPKSSKMELIIQKATELGIHKIIPLISERSQIKLGPDRAKDKLIRWQKIAKAAAEQSGRLVVPEITDIQTFTAAIKQAQDYQLAIIPWEEEKEKNLKAILKKNKSIENILLLIGPEGGFSQSEAALAEKAGFTPTSLGRRILRTETAGMAALAMILYEYEL